MGMEINAGTFTPKRDIEHTHEGSLGNLCLKEIREKMKKLI
jgi:argininosuccinate lyase